MNRAVTSRANGVPKAFLNRRDGRDRAMKGLFRGIYSPRTDLLQGANTTEKMNARVAAFERRADGKKPRKEPVPQAQPAEWAHGGLFSTTVAEPRENGENDTGRSNKRVVPLTVVVSNRKPEPERPMGDNGVNDRRDVDASGTQKRHWMKTAVSVG